MVPILSSDDVMHNLTKECVAVQLFINLLKKEEDALIHGKMEEVDLLASEKNRVIAEITDYSAMRCQQLSYQGFSSDSSGMNDWLAEQSESEEKSEIWSELLQLAHEVQQLNHTNGMIISTRLQHVQHASAALQSAAGNISLYGPKGQATGF